jgi:MFS transporter, FHS family, L-fucose permease
MDNNKTNYGAFSILITVFFFWGFVAASNDILIPVFKEKLNLSQVQAQMVSFAFYVAYSVGALIYYFVSKAIGQDLLNKIGFKNGISLGLIISALGILLFIPAANNASFNLFIIGLFIVGLGFSLQQTAANPLAISMGARSTSSQRLSMAGGINNLGTTIGPLIVKFAIFGSAAVAGATIDLATVKAPYLILGLAFLVVAVIFYFSSVPNTLESSQSEDELKLSAANDRGSAFKYPQLIMGMIAIFVYVGVEVSTAANLPEYMKQKLGTSTAEVAPYISMYWASMMIGRWTASSMVLSSKSSVQNMLKVLMPYLAFGVFLLVNTIAKNDLTPFWAYAFVILIMIFANYLAGGNPSRELLIFSLCGIIALLIGMFSPNPKISVYAFCSVGLFCSTLWPCIFTLATTGLGKHTSNGSNFLIFMIMGGGIVSIIQGYLAEDSILGISMSYVVGIVCFAYMAYYALKAASDLKEQGFSLDQSVKSGGGH